MGASGWDYFTPYREDVSQALEELRKRVFQSKEYGNSIWKPESLHVYDTLLAEAAPEDRPQLEASRARHVAAMEQYAIAKSQQVEPITIDDLLEQCNTEGTHSILDICLGVSQGPAFATAFPMPDEVLADLFNSTRPTRGQIEAEKHARSDELERWQCWYVIVYKDDRPDEIYFEGCSGD